MLWRAGKAVCGFSFFVFGEKTRFVEARIIGLIIYEIKTNGNLGMTIPVSA